MASDPLFESAWLKWGQAMRHAEALQADLVAWLAIDGNADPLLGVQTEYHPKRHGFGVYASAVRSTPARWGLVLGDVAHNLRSSLDHLAWALVSRGIRPPSLLSDNEAEKIYFPIAEGKTWFDKSLPKKLPGVRSADIARIRWCQPYRRGKRDRHRHSLVLLNRLNIRDKHRTLEPVWHQPTHLNLEVTDMRDCVIRRFNWRRTPEPLKVDAELAYIPARKTGKEPHLHVQTRCTAKPSIEHRIEVEEWMTQCGILVWLLLRRFSEPSEEIINMAEPWLERLAVRERHNAPP